MEGQSRQGSWDYVVDGGLCSEGSFQRNQVKMWKALDLVLVSMLMMTCFQSGNAIRRTSNHSSTESALHHVHDLRLPGFNLDQLDNELASTYDAY